MGVHIPLHVLYQNQPPLNTFEVPHQNLAPSNFSPPSNPTQVNAPLTNNYNQLPLNSYGRPMSFIEREVFEQQRREAEFKQSRQEMGMMTLQDTIALWKSKDYDGNSRPNSSSGFNVRTKFYQFYLHYNYSFKSSFIQLLYSGTREYHPRLQHGLLSP